MKKATVQDVDFNDYKRVIVMSDIHGDSESFCNALKQCCFGHEDALVIVGDLLEKGSKSLELLRDVIKLSETYAVYPLLGNNDTIFDEWYDHEVSDEDIWKYMNSRETSILIEMATELEVPYQRLDDIKILKKKIRETYQKELQFLHGLPVIIDSELATFVHAGIKVQDIYDQDYEYCLCAPAFSEVSYHFSKPVIVGHWPASNYCDKIIQVQAYFNEKNNVISIDGGNSMKSWGQINYLIIEKGNIQSFYYDHCPKIIALDDQSEDKEEPLSLIYPHTEIQIQKQIENQILCYVPYFDQNITIHQEDMYEYKGKVYCYDFTTYKMPVKKGEILSYCEKIKDGIQVKRNGIIGNYFGRYQFVDEK